VEGLSIINQKLSKLFFFFMLCNYQKCTIAKHAKHEAAACWFLSPAFLVGFAIEENALIFANCFCQLCCNIRNPFLSTSLVFESIKIQFKSRFVLFAKSAFVVVLDGSPNLVLQQHPLHKSRALHCLLVVDFVFIASLLPSMFS
jgi:hypothetical protein